MKRASRTWLRTWQTVSSKKCSSKSEMTLQKIARLVGGELSGNPEVRITSLSGIREARPGDLTFLANPKYREFLRTTRASAVIVGLEESSSYIPLIRVREPYLAYQRVAET